MKVRDIMTTAVVTVTPDTSFKQAVDLLLTFDVSGLPVVDAEGRVIGVVTEADLVPKPAYGGRRRRALRVVADLFTGADDRWSKGQASTVGEVMSIDVTVARPDEEVAAVARRMLAAKVKRLPIVDESGHPVGLVSRHDLLGSYFRPDEVIAGDVTAVLDDPASCPEDAAVRATVDEGVVALDGDVLHPSDRQVVEAAVWRVPGVVDVVDRLSYREPEPTIGPYVGTPG